MRTEVLPLEERFERPDEFDLAAYWNETTAAFEAAADRAVLEIRVDPEFMGRLVDSFGVEIVERAEHLDVPDPDGWTRLRLTVEWPLDAHARMLRMSGHAEILAPPEIRERVIASALSILNRYGEALPVPGSEAADRGRAPDGDAPPADVSLEPSAGTVTVGASRSG